MDFRVALLLVLEALFALWLLRRSGCIKTAPQWSAAVTLLLAAFVARLLALRYQTLDYQNFLAHWVEYFRQNGGFRALKDPIGNYNIPYLYFLALFSYSTVSDLYLIKLLSVFFDVLLAWSALRLVSRLTESPLRRVGVFFATLFLPTVFLNGSFWGQCDSVYVALALLALADALDEHPVRAMILLALSFGFKLQAVFIMPVFAVLFFTGRIRWRDLPVFPLSYVVLVLPAVIAGRPFKDTILLYANQTGSIGSGLNYNSPSVFAFFRNVSDPSAAAKAGIFAAFAFMLLLLTVCYLYRRQLNDRLILIAALLFAVGIPFFLPHMHDRYFFAADALSLILAFGVPLLAPVAALTEFASILGYYAYLVMKWLLTMEHGARALIAVLLILWAVMLSQLKAAAPAGIPAAREGAQKELDNRE